MKVELIWIDAYACFILCVPPPKTLQLILCQEWPKQMILCRKID